MFSGYPGDVNNTIALDDVYAPSGLDMPTDIGWPSDLYVNTAPMNDALSSGAPVQSNNSMSATAGSSTPGKPGHWWLTFALVFIGFIVVARRFGGEGQQYGNIKANVYNGLFLTFFIVLMLNMMKVIAAKFPPNPVSALILAA